MEHKKTTQMFIFSYLIIIFIVIALMAVIRYTVTTQVVTDIEKNNELLLTNIKQLFDARFSNIEKMISYVSETEEVQEWSNNYTADDATRTYKALGLMSVLSNGRELYGTFDECFLYFDHMGKAVSADNFAESAVFYSRINPDMTLAEWEAMISTDTKAGFVRFKTKDGKNKYLYVCREYFTRKKLNKFSCVFVSDIDKSVEEIQKIFNNGLTVYIRQNSGLLPIHVDDDAKISDYEEVIENEESSEDYIYYSKKTNNFVKEYIVLISTQYSLRTIRVINTMFLLVILLAIIFIASVGIVYGKHSIFKIRSILNDNVLLQSKMRNNENILKNTILLNLINGYGGFGEDHKIYEMCSLKFSTDNFAVAIISFDNTSDTDMVEGYAVYNVFNELMDEESYSYFAYDDKYGIIIINLKDGNVASYYSAIKEKISLVRQIVEEQFKVKLLFSSSTVVNGINNLNRAYKEALEIMDNMKICGESNGIFSEDFDMFNKNCNGDNTGGTETTFLERKVIQYINSHYSDPNLSLEVIAKEMNMNSTYLSKSFKMKSGIGILDKINAVRISNSIPLLSDSFMTIRDVARMVGYINFRTFSTNFKKYCGLTPSEYRNNVQNKVKGEEI